MAAVGGVIKQEAWMESTGRTQIDVLKLIHDISGIPGGQSPGCV